MSDTCGRRYPSNLTKKIEICKNKAPAQCANCGENVCWLHNRRRCPKGKLTKFGAIQHLTEAQDTSLRQASKIHLKRAAVTTDVAGEQATYEAGVVLEYMDEKKNKREVRFWVGHLHSATGQPPWIADAELNGWLEARGAKLNPDGTPRRWQQPQHCTQDILAAASNR